MSDAKATNDDRDLFWTRLRGALSGLRPGGRRAESEPAYGVAAIVRPGRDPVTARIEDCLRRGWAQSARAKVSMAVMAIEIDRFRELHLCADSEAVERAIRGIREAVEGHLPRPTDLCLRHGRSGLVVVLPDYPMLMARRLARTLSRAVRGLGLPHKESHAGVVTIGIGLAVANPRDAYEGALFEETLEALARAQRQGLDRLEARDLRPRQRAEERAA